MKLLSTDGRVGAVLGRRLRCAAIAAAAPRKRRANAGPTFASVDRSFS